MFQQPPTKAPEVAALPDHIQIARRQAKEINDMLMPGNRLSLIHI